MLPFWVYMIEVKRLIRNNEKKTIYTGYTSNLTKRIEQHRNNKGARYTMGKKEIKLLYTESYSNRSDAMKREIEIKKLKKKEKEALVAGYSSLPLNNLKDKN